MPKGLDVVDKRLESDDNLGKSYTRRGDGKRNPIMMSKEDIRLVEEHGFTQMSADLLQENPCTTSVKIRMESPIKSPSPHVMAESTASHRRMHRSSAGPRGS
ncbi:hypothetical protein AC480_02920 [miscellaneous Crenarchaeota group archaeon SMTZ1-55]|nr:MAG: hypothetical protein AC480_02920 [miscellaneous Crenarchaeota group archaeon SMTZ1-55]